MSDDQDGYDDSGRPSPKSHRITAHNFEMNQAEDDDETEGEDSEGEEEDSANEEDEKFIDRDEDQGGWHPDRLAMRERRKERSEMEKQKKAFAKMYESEQRSHDDYHEDEVFHLVQDDSAVEASAAEWRIGLQPTGGKKLFMVATRPGKEFQVVLDMTKRYFSGDIAAPTVYSALCPVPGCGYIYVEALTDAEVSRLRNGVQNCLFNKDIKPLPISEMRDAMSVTPQTPKLRPGQFVRIRRDRPNTDSYKGDLAQVVLSNSNRNKALVKLVPRIDYDQLKEFVGDGESRDGMTRECRQSLLTKNKKDSTSYRPPQREFDEKRIKDIGGEVEKVTPFKSFLKPLAERPDRFSLWDDCAFYKSFAYKDYPIAYLDTNSVNPSTEEARRFIDGLEVTKFERSIPGFRENMAASLAGAMFKFEVGDKARANREFRGMLVIVKQVNDGDTCVVRPQNENLDIEIEKIYLEKYFERGERVQIVAGVHEGSIGVVQDTDDKEGVAQVLLDTTMATVEVKFGQLISASQTNQQTTWGPYRVHDMVSLQDRSVGVIYSIEQNGTFHILLTTSQTKEAMLENIAQKVRDQRVKDKAGNLIAVDRQVNIESRDERISMTARVLHTYGSHVFVKCDSLENQGVKLVESSECKTNATRNEEMRMPMFQGGGGGGRRYRQAANRSYIGKQVYILSGQYKGCMADVKDCDDTSLRVALHTNGQTVNLLLSEGPEAQVASRWTWAKERKRDPFGKQKSKPQQPHPAQPRMEQREMPGFLRPDPYYGMSPDSMHSPASGYSPNHPYYPYGASPTMGTPMYSMDRGGH